MFKLILVLLIAIGAAFYFPATRPRMVHYAQPITRPLLDWRTRSEMSSIAQDLTNGERASHNLPDPRTQFGPWLRDQYQGDAGKDAWGTPYGLQVFRDSFSITSAGADRVPGTSDDLRVSKKRLYPGRR